MSGLESFMMLTRDIQESVMMIRAQPVKPLFQRMARIVREAWPASARKSACAPMANIPRSTRPSSNVWPIR